MHQTSTHHYAFQLSSEPLIILLWGRSDEITVFIAKIFMNALAGDERAVFLYTEDLMQL